MTFSITNYNSGEKLILEGSQARVARSPYKVTIPSKYSKELAYLAGYHLGDGYLDNFEKRPNRGDFEILYADEYENQIKKIISPIIEKNFSIVLRIQKKLSNMWVGRVNCKVLHIFLHQILEMPIGKKGDFQVPSWISQEQDFVKEFISGFSDAEGSIFIDKLGKAGISLTNSNYRFLVEIKDFLKKYFKTEFGPIYMKPNYHKNPVEVFEMKTRAKNQILLFCNRISFRHPHKVQKMKECILRLKKVKSRKTAV